MYDNVVQDTLDFFIEFLALFHFLYFIISDSNAKQQRHQGKSFSIHPVQISQ